nr:Sterile alpha motif SAM and PDZ and Pleckstrin homology and GDP-fucose protein O-fucosyltransferase domain containing protein [Haemonchus contortus]
MFSSLPQNIPSNIPIISFQQYVESWSGKQVARWIEGLGDAMNPYLGTIRDNIRSGKYLHLIDDEMLANIGITALGPRKTILQAVQLLLYFCTEAPSENLQSHSMKVVVACKAVIHELEKAQRCRDEKPLTRTHIVSVLNSISLMMSVLVENVKKLVFWLDRSPFDDIKNYISIRNRISTAIWELVRSVNVQPKSLFGIASEIIQKTNDLKEQCDCIVRDTDDPLVLYTAYTERALLRRHDVNTNWGINLQSSYRGVHVISEVKVGSPADLCGRIDAGDEIMLINGKTVIGWDLTRVAQRLGSSSDTELHLVVNKRPRHSVPFPLKKTLKANRPLAKIIPGSQATETAGKEKQLFKDITYPLNRRRSSTFIGDLLNLMESKGEKLRTSRRASFCAGSPRREFFLEEDERSYVSWDLLDLIGHPSPDNHEGPIAIPRIVRRARTMRHQPDGYVRSFIDNKLVQEVEDDIIAEQLPFNVGCPAEFAEVCVVEPPELNQLNILEPSCSDPDWSAPYEEASLQRFRAPAGDSNLSCLTLDSPRFTTVSGSDDQWVLPSPASLCSIPSVCSPTPLRLTPTREWNAEDTPPTPSTPDMKSAEKTFEGWVRRRKTAKELFAKEVTNKWPKCWMCLRGPFLCIYPTQFTRHADMIINISKCTVSDETELKTSKKFVFRLSRPPVEHHFSCYNQNDMRMWIHKIKVASEMYGAGNRAMSKSVSNLEVEHGESPFEHYNTLTGLPSLMTQSQREEPRSSSPVSNTLPRSTTGSISKHLKPTAPKFISKKSTVSVVNSDKYSLARDRRYLIYDVNHGEGFNLRRDVYMRIANTVRLLRKAGEPFVLVLPPWGGLYHWQTQGIKLRWSLFFDVESLNEFVPVVEFEDFLNENGPHLDQVVYLQPYKEGWSDEYKLKYDHRPCIDGSRFYHQESESSWRGWFFSYDEVRAKKFECISIQGDSATLRDLILKEYPDQMTIFFDRGEAVLHENYGDVYYWEARRREPFVLVLPPWGGLYHWQTQGIKLRWSLFFDVESLNEFVPVVEFEDFLNENGPHLDQVVYLQPYKEGWSDEYKLKYDHRPCIDGSRFYHQESESSWRGWFFSYDEVRAKKFECISIQGDSATLRDLILKEYPDQ